MWIEEEEQRWRKREEMAISRRVSPI